MGFSEILVILVLGLVILGPDKLLGVIKTSGYWIRKVKVSVDEAKSQISQELNNSEIKKNFDNYKESIEDIQKELVSSTKDIDLVNEGISKTFAKSISGDKNKRVKSNKSTGTKSTGANKASKAKISGTRSKISAAKSKSNKPTTKKSTPVKVGKGAIKETKVDNKLVKKKTKASPKTSRAKKDNQDGKKP